MAAEVMLLEEVPTGNRCLMQGMPGVGAPSRRGVRGSASAFSCRHRRGGTPKPGVRGPASTELEALPQLHAQTQ